MNIIKQASVFLKVFLMIILLSACGSKGDLYHASEPSAEQKDQKNSQNETSEETKKKAQ